MENPLLKYLALVKTVETGSFTLAAQALNYAQSSVSKMVADLEAEWDMTLLERSKRGVCLTSAGEQVLPFLRKVLNDHAELEGQICRMNGIEALNGLPFCCWSTAERPRSPTCSSARTCSQTSGLRRGRILRSWLWQNAGSASGSCRI